MTHIYRLGVELEGGWDRTIPGEVIGRDSSVEDLDCDHAGELASKPLKLEPLLEWVKLCHPQYVNDSCGMHVHLSLKRLDDYTRLMDPRFAAYFKASMESLGQEMVLPEHHEFWKRLSGKNHYCEANFIPQQQYSAKDKPSTRYTQLNFCWAYHGTVECRLFPAFETYKQAQQAITGLVKCVDGYLDKPERVKPRLLQFMLMDDEGTVQTKKFISRKGGPVCALSSATTPR